MPQPSQRMPKEAQRKPCMQQARAVEKETPAIARRYLMYDVVNEIKRFVEQNGPFLLPHREREKTVCGETDNTVGGRVLCACLCVAAIFEFARNVCL
jgi:hypothetical protein